MSEYRKIILPTCPYCHKTYEWHESWGGDAKYESDRKLVRLAKEAGAARNAIIHCDSCGQWFRATVTIRYHGRKLKKDERPH